MDETIQKGIDAYKAGRMDEARELVGKYLDQHPDNEKAWDFLASIAVDKQQKILCLEQIIRIEKEKTKKALSESNNKEDKTHPATTEERKAPPANEIRQAKTPGWSTIIRFIGITLIILLVLVGVVGLIGRFNSPVIASIPPSPPTAKPSETITPHPTATTTNTPAPTSTKPPFIPGTYVYEGVCTFCSCQNCICVTNLLFKLQITIDGQGKVTGALDKYITDYESIQFSGDIYKFTGSTKNLKDRNESANFTGSFSKDMKTITATILYLSTKNASRRELYFTRK